MEYHKLPSAIEKCANDIRKIDSVLKDLDSHGQEYLSVETNLSCAMVSAEVLLPALNTERARLAAHLDKMQHQHQTLTDVAAGLLK